VEVILMVEKIFENNNVLKIVAFLLALLMWFFVNSDGQPRTELSRTFSNVPVTWQNLDNDFVVTRPPDNVDVVIRGDSSVLDAMVPQDLIIYVDLQGKKAGTHTLPVAGTSPRGTRITNWNPRTLEIEIDEIINLQIEVKLQIEGEPAEGYITGTPELSPPQVFVQGPRNRVQEVASIYAIINIEGLQEDLQVTALLQTINFNGQPATGVTVIPDTVDILLPIQKPDKEVTVHVPIVGEPKEGFQLGEILISPARIKISGFMEYLASILRLETEPIDISDADEDVEREVKLVLPDGISALEEIISVTVQIKQE
jgi:YbbR domain-containing protein